VDRATRLRRLHCVFNHLSNNDLLARGREDDVLLMEPRRPHVSRRRVSRTVNIYFIADTPIGAIYFMCACFSVSLAA
jgi:hypothetical protein